MVQLIEKSALLSEIDRQKIGYNVDGKHSVEYDITRNIIDIINTLEVKEVNLEKEIKRFTMSKELYEADSVIKAVAEHFFELGLKAQKGE